MKENETKMPTIGEIREMSRVGQENSRERAMNEIDTAARMGFTEVVLFSTFLNTETAAKLMSEGYMVGTFTNPFDGKKFFKISW